MNSNIRFAGISTKSCLWSEKVHFDGFTAKVCILLAVISITSLIGCAPEKWEQKVSKIVWVAYSPTTADPGKGIKPTPETIREDFVVLRKARFTGLVTYSSSGILGRELPALAESQGFKGMIVGIWDPTNEEEIVAAKATAEVPVVLGFCVGNEGLGKRYQLAELSATIQHIREITGKPVTTTEEIDDYSDENLLQFGDWVFPNTHPYFHNRLNPDAAVRWTQGAYEDLKRRSNRFVMFKEVGLPTAGDANGKLSEEVQERYYIELAKTDVRFVYFEAFDLPWKTHLPIEPHWGIFQSDRTPKRLGWRLMQKEPPSQTIAEEAFYIYSDADSPNNHYKPTGNMGDCGDIHINEVFEENPHSGETCIRVVYEAKGKGPYTCSYPPPCKWAGVYWQEPPNNWGKDTHWQGRGFNLSRYNRLLFWARADKVCTIEFKVGGIDEPYGDSLKFPQSKSVRFSENWQEFEIDLKGADLKHIIGGFCWVTNWDANPDGITFYLDDIRFERR